MVLKYNYLPEENEQNLITYKYNGKDNSLLYNYIFGPLADFQVKYIFPKWLAPNVITLMGFFCVLIPFIIIWNQTGEDVTKVIDKSYFLWAAIFFLLYFNFDNVDGK